MKSEILIVDDEKPTRDVLARVLSRQYTCLTAPDAESALALAAEHPDLALLLTDYKMPGEDGISLIRAFKTTHPQAGAILVTAFGEIELAVRAMREGASDFITKPITDLDQLELRIAKALPVSAAKGGKTKNAADALGDFTGRSPAMEKVYDLIRKVAPTNASVLVEGPSGSGKELVARALHRLSARADKPFVAVECAALSSTLLESELFGYEAHAFTGADAKRRIGRFEAANGGTLFLDEIGEISPETQVKLLRVLESRTIQRVGGTEDIPVDFRLVTATNRHLLDLVAAGAFREDLFYRLDVIDITLPPLSARPGDVKLLAERFCREFSATNGNRITGFEPAALDALARLPWPGNVRQLRNAIEKMVILSAGPLLTTADIPAPLAATPHNAAPSVITEQTAPGANRPLAETEKEQILSAVEACGGNKSKAADMLGVSRRTLHRKFKKWGLA